MNYVDPFGAPEYFCNKMVLESAAPGLVKARMIIYEKGEAILRCTLLLPDFVLASNIKLAREFLTETPSQELALSH